jgi:DnaA family protein
MQYTLALPLSPDATFDNYVGMARRKLDDLSEWNLVFGASGSGRSHLLQALCHQEENHQEDRLEVGKDRRLYLGELGRLAPAVLKDLEAFTVICLDDVDQVFGQPDWEEALFHLLNACKDWGSKLVIAVDRPVALLPIELPDLKSRLSAAQAIETDTLSDESKIEVMRRRAKHWGFELPEEVAEFILRRSPRGTTALIDNLKRLELETLRAHRKVTIPFAKQTLQF